MTKRTVGMLATAASFLVALVFAARQAQPEQVLSLLPLGSGVEEVGAVIDQRSVWHTEVTQWSPVNGKSVTGAGQYRKNPIGSYYGSGVRDSQSFTGEILIYYSRPFADSVAMTLRYVNGRLVHKDWGYMPG